MTEPGKYAPGLKGFPTPNTADSVQSYLLFLFPDEKWAQWVLGAVKTLETDWNWYESGDLSPDEAAEAFRLINEQAPYNVLEEKDVPAPFWDDGTDVDASAPPDAQTWYGELQEAAALSFFALEDEEPTLTFFEELRLWLIIGFVAYAGTPAAAIAFAPFARKFVLTFKKATAGAIVRLFFDSLHIADIDTYGVEDDVIQFLVDVGVDPTGQELWIEHSGEHNPDATPNENGEYIIGVVRDQLTPDDVAPPDTRYDVDCNCVQTTYDGGGTWVETPARDPRHGDYFIIPPAGEDFRCDAAGGMVKLVQQVVGSVLHAADVLGVANAILAILTLLSGGAGIIFDLIIVVAEALITIGASTLNGYFDETAYAVLLCAFYCSIEPDGAVTAADVVKIQAYVDANASGGVSTVMAIFLNLWGEVQLQNAGVRFADSSADCTACDCCVTPITADTPYQNFPAIPTGIFASYNQVIGQGGLWYASAEGDGGTWTMTLDHAVEIRGVGFNCNAYGGAQFTVTIGTQSTTLDYGGVVGWTLTVPQVSDTITMVQESIPSNIRLSMNAFQVVYCEAE